MNSKELIKKIDIGRVGDGSVSYNDVCLSLNKEETLELLQYVEQLEKELKRSQEYIQKSTNDHKNLIIENGKMKKSIEILKNKIVNIPKLLTTTLIVYNELALLLGYDKLTQEEFELLKEVLGYDR